jgi:hypothetical protein
MQQTRQQWRRAMPKGTPSTGMDRSDIAVMTAALSTPTSRLVSRLYVRGLAVALLGIDQQRHAHARCDGAQRLEVVH